ncbi:MAG: CHASE domain-containing protein [Phormidesmis sp.]
MSVYPPKLSVKLPIVLTLIVGTGLSILASVAIARQERANDRLQFQRQTDSLATSLQRSINRYTDILLAIGDFYAVSEQRVSRDEFARFVARSLTTYPGIQALEWAPVVDSTERAAFESAVRAAGYPTFQITERENSGSLVRAKARPYYIPVTYLQPWQSNELAFGYDLTSDAIRRTALETARDTGEVAASGRIRLVQDDKNQFGVLVFLPLYQSQRQPESIPARREQLQGYLLVVFRISDVVEDSLKTFSYDIDFTLTDQTAAPGEQFLGLYQASSQTVTTAIPQEGFAIAKPTLPSRSHILASENSLCSVPAGCVHLLEAGGREWAIAFTPATSYSALTPWRALSMLTIGLLLTGIIARYLFQAQAKALRAQELSSFKIRLFSMASHELRTPLSTILLSAQVLEADSLTTDRERIYGRIRAAAKRMNRLLNDLLTLARAESGKIDFSPETLNLKLFSQQLIEEVKFSFENPPNIELMMAEEDDPKVYLDPQLLRATLTNLLSNAVKYTNTTPQVTLLITRCSQKIVFQVKDKGIGISKTDQQRLYEAFYRGSNVGEIGGTGLGLSVVSACLQIHQGTLTCQSELGKGTTFEVVVPQVD